MCLKILDCVLGLVRLFSHSPFPFVFFGLVIKFVAALFPCLYPPPSVRVYRKYPCTYADASTEWEDGSHFDTFVASENFQTFKSVVKPHSVAPPVPQLYNTDFEPSEVFGSTLTEVWQAKVGEDDGKVVELKAAWEKFVSVVAEVDGIDKSRKSIQGTSLNLEERRWVGVFGWENIEVSSNAS